MGAFRLHFCAAAALALAYAPIAAQAEKARGLVSHDGVYSVEVYTQSGACDRVYRWTINVAGGRVVSGGDGFMQASGRISENGAVSLAFRRDNQVANVTGRVKGGAASGAWSSPTMQCAGSWRAARIS